jgi:Dyp-type peroxidase family
MTDVPWADVQRLVLRGYPDMPAAAFLLLRVRAPVAARKWLDGLAQGGQITSGESGGGAAVTTCLNVAFTPTGLATLGVEEKFLRGFADPFLEGMTAEHRRTILGDTGPSRPEEWAWGGPKNPEIHVLLLLYAADDARLQQLIQEQRQTYQAHGLEETALLDRAVSLPGRKEHFGFRDGISQPTIRGQQKSRREEDTLVAGEFLLGHHNESDRLPGKRTLPRMISDNGSYLVFRQLEQDVRKFWRFVDERTGDAAERRLIASKLIGRDPSGTPLIPGGADDNDFAFARQDPDGYQCPIGAHIRRANPRDMFAPDITRRHRIIRRGRAYGPPLVPSMDVEDIVKEARKDPPAQESRGLYFLCLNADIVEQFEFIQQSWLNSKHFGGLYDEVDPIVGDLSQTNARQFTVPEHPLARRLIGLQRFVEVRGGGYFFLPGIAAIKRVASGRGGGLG